MTRPLKEYFNHSAALAAEMDRVAVYASGDDTYELGFINVTPVRASVQSPWVYRIQKPFMDMHAGIETSHASEFYYAERYGSYPALRLDNPAEPRDIPQFLYVTVGDYWAAQLRQEELRRKE